MPVAKIKVSKIKTLTEMHFRWQLWCNWKLFRQHNFQNVFDVDHTNYVDSNAFIIITGDLQNVYSWKIISTILFRS